MKYDLTKRKFNVNFLSAMPLDEVFYRIKEALKQKGLNQKKLAEQLGVSEPTISRFMKGNRGLSVETLLKIADILGVESASLMPGGNPKPKLDFEKYIIQIVKNGIEEDIKKDIRIIVREEIKNALENK